MLQLYKMNGKGISFEELRVEGSDVKCNQKSNASQASNDML